MEVGGINTIKSYYTRTKTKPVKIQEGEWMVYDYPETFEPFIEKIFKRMIKNKVFTPEAPKVKVMRKRIPKKVNIR